MTEKYNVVLEGSRPGTDAQQVGQQLAALFKCTLEQAAALLAKPSIVIKKEVAPDLAERYRKAIEKTGANCVVAPVTVEPPLVFDAVEQFAPAAAPLPLPIASSPTAQPPAVSPPTTQPPEASSADASPTPILEPASHSIPSSEQVSPSSANGTLTREEAVRILVDKNHEYYIGKWEAASLPQDPPLSQWKYTRKFWNWAAFFLTFNWLAYRKMYRYLLIYIAIIVIQVIIEITVGLPTAVSSAINVASFVLFGKHGNAWFKRHVDQEVDRILATSANADQARVELARRGGTNIAAAIGCAVSYILIVVLSINMADF